MKVYEEDESVNLCKGLRLWSEKKWMKGREEGREEGKLEGLKFIALRMNEKGNSLEEIANLVGVGVETVEKWLNSADN